MNLAILGTRGIPARYGGFETFAEKLAIGIRGRGIHVTVFCESGEGNEPEVLEGVELRYVSAQQLGPLRTILYDVKCLWAARKGYDIVYMLGYGAAPFCVVPRFWGTEVWINPDGLEWARAKWGLVARLYFRLMEWVSLRVADRLIADSEAIVASLVSRHRKLPPHSVIAYGCEVVEKLPSVASLSGWGLTSGNYYLIVCRLEPENHVLEILKAFQQSKSERELIIVGNNLSRTPYVQRLRSVRDPRIRMIGTVYDQAKLACLRYYAFAYIHGHSVGGTNPSLLEAMGCGSLIFAHDNPFNRASMGECGLYFLNSVELTNTIDEVEVDLHGIGRFREAAKRRASANFRWSDIVARYAELIEETVQPTRESEEIFS